MSPEQRKQASELQLHKRGIRINVQLHVIESDEEVTLRSSAEVLQRLIALWAVSSAAVARDCAHFRDYLATHQMTSYLSKQEQAFMFSAEATEESAGPARQPGTQRFFDFSYASTPQARSATRSPSKPEGRSVSTMIRTIKAKMSE